MAFAHWLRQNSEHYLMIDAQRRMAEKYGRPAPPKPRSLVERFWLDVFAPVYRQITIAGLNRPSERAASFIERLLLFAGASLFGCQLSSPLLLVPSETVQLRTKRIETLLDFGNVGDLQFASRLLKL